MNRRNHNFCDRGPDGPGTVLGGTRADSLQVSTPFPRVASGTRLPSPSRKTRDGESSTKPFLAAVVAAARFLGGQFCESSRLTDPLPRKSPNCSLACNNV